MEFAQLTKFAPLKRLKTVFCTSLKQAVSVGRLVLTFNTLISDVKFREGVQICFTSSKISFQSQKFVINRRSVG